MRIDVGTGIASITLEGRVVYLLLSGGDKSAQASDIRRAKDLWESFSRLLKYPSMEAAPLRVRSFCCNLFALRNLSADSSSFSMA
jgi:hypothetical protein